MSFYETRFPVDISFGAEGGPTWKTLVVIVDSGFESRNASWAVGRLKYDVSHGVKTQAQLDALVDFFRAMKGKAHGFRFKDWADYTVTNEPFPATTSTSLQLQKTYTGGTSTAAEIRIIRKPVTGVTIRTNGVAYPSYTVSTTTGVVLLSSAPAISDVLDWTGEFDVPMRFDTDEMQVKLDAPGLYSWGRIPVIEIRTT